MRIISALMLALVCLSGCTAKWKQVITDEAAQCGPGLLSAVLKSKDVLMQATSTDAALAEINQILQAAGADASAIWCVVKVALDDLKAQRGATGGFAPAASQLRVASYPADPVAHGIAVGQDIMALKK